MGLEFRRVLFRSVRSPNFDKLLTETKTLKELQEETLLMVTED